MEAQQDFKELLACLNARGAEYMIVASVSGVAWEDAAPRRVPGQYGEASVFYIGRADLIANKKACGRRKDLADLEALGERPGG